MKIILTDKENVEERPCMFTSVTTSKGNMTEYHYKTTLPVNTSEGNMTEGQLYSECAAYLCKAACRQSRHW